jgi:hypothetical protein
VWQALLEGKSGMRPVAVRRAAAQSAGGVGDGPGDSSFRAAREMACATIRKALASSQSRARRPGGALVLSTSLGAYLDEEPRATPLSGWARDVARELGAFAADCDFHRMFLGRGRNPGGGRVDSFGSRKMLRLRRRGCPDAQQAAGSLGAGHHVADPFAGLRRAARWDAPG